VVHPPDHFIVCGGNALANRLVAELRDLYDVSVSAIVPSTDDAHVTQIMKKLNPEAVVVSDALTEEALQEAGVAEARGIAFVDGDDQSNIHAALRAQGMNPGIRIVIRMYNQRLREHIRQLIANCAALSASETAAPAFVNAALRRPNTVQAGGRSLSVALGDAIDTSRLPLCVVADQIDPSDPSTIEMLPRERNPTMRWIEEDVLRLASGAGSGRAVLQFIDGEPRVVISRISRLRWRLIDAWRFFTSAQLQVVMVVAGTAVLASFIGIWVVRPVGWAVYETVLNIAGSAVPDTYGQSSSVGGTWQRVFQVATTLSGILLVPIVTAVLVENTGSARRGSLRPPSAGVRGHFVVVGLGNVGTRVALLARDLGIPVVCVERDENARGIATVRGHDIPVVIGEGPVVETLRRARVDTCRAVLALTGDDVSNLEAALEAREINPEVRVVVRLFDDDFAAHVYGKVGNAASAFAAALMGQEVLGTLSVYRHVLLLAEITVDEESKLLGQALRDIDSDGAIRIVALHRVKGPAYEWRPADHGHRLAVGDTVIVAATRAGLGYLHGRAA
jgi:voltage-gated potassium channel Kch